MVSEQLLAAIIAGEGGFIAEAEEAVAGVLARHIRVLGYDEATLKSKWFGWNNAASKVPSPHATKLAAGILSGDVATSPYEFCMSNVDVRHNHWLSGTAQVQAFPYGLHLYEKWPTKSPLAAGEMRIFDYPVPSKFTTGRPNTKFGLHHFPVPCQDMSGRSLDWHRERITLMAAMGATWISIISSDGGDEGYRTNQPGCSELTFQLATEARLMGMVRTYNSGVPRYWNAAVEKLIDRLLTINGGKPIYWKICNEIDAEWKDATGRYMTLDDAKWCVAAAADAIDRAWAKWNGRVIPSFLNVGYGGAGFNFFEIAHDLGLSAQLGRCWVPVHPYAGAWPLDYPWSDVLLKPELLTQAQYDAYGDYAWGKGTAALQTLDFVNKKRTAAWAQRNDLRDVASIMGAYAYGFFTWRWARYMLDQLGHYETPLLFPECGTRVGETVEGLPQVGPKLHAEMTRGMIVEMQQEPTILGSGFWFFDASEGGFKQNWLDQAWRSPVFKQATNLNMPADWKREIKTDGQLPIVDELLTNPVTPEWGRATIQGPCKLGGHFQLGDARCLTLVLECPATVVKTMNLDPVWCAKLKGAAGKALVVGRAYVTDQGRFVHDQAGLIAELLGLYAPAIASLDAVEFTNEAVNNSTSKADLAAFDRCQYDFAQAVWARWPDKKVVLFNLPVGNWGMSGEPKLADCPLSMGLPVERVYIGCHCYGWPTLVDGAEWYALRYRAILAEHPYHKAIINECGVTHAIVPGFPDVGWRTQAESDARQRYIAGLVWFGQQIAADAQIAGATVYNCGPSYGWDTFESTDEVRAAWSALQDGTVIVPEPPEEPPEEPGGGNVELVNDTAAYGVRVVLDTTAPEGAWYWKLVRLHHLTPQENNGMLNLFIDILDENGARVNGAEYQCQWGTGKPDETITGTIDKPADEPGGNMPLYNVRQIVSVIALGLPSDRAENIHTDHPDEPPVTGWGHNGNSRAHHSFLAVFQKTRKGTVVVEPPVEPPAEPPTGVAPTDEELRAAAWAQRRSETVLYNDAAALLRFARSKGLGCPVTNEGDFRGFRIQGFAGGFVVCKIGEWDKARVLTW